MTSVLTFVDRWLAEGFLASDRDLAFGRITFGLVGFLLLLPDWTWFTALPGAWFEPRVGTPLLFGTPPAEGGVVLLQALLGLALLAVMVGWRTRAASRAVTVIAIVGFGFEYGHRAVAHHLVFWIAPALLASVWGAAWSFDARRSGPGDSDPAARRGRPEVALLALALALLFVGALAFKLDGGWLQSDRQAVASFLLASHDAALVRPATWSVLQSARLWEWVDRLTLVLEALPILLVWRPRWFQWLLVPLAAFHLAILVTLRVDFISDLAVFVLLVPVVSTVGPRLGPTVQAWLRRAATVPVGAVLLAGVVLAVALNGHGFTNGPRTTTVAVFEVVASSLLGAVVVVTVALGSLGRPRTLAPSASAGAEAGA